MPAELLAGNEISGRNRGGKLKVAFKTHLSKSDIQEY